MIDHILRRATGARAAIAVGTLGIGGSLLFRLSPYENLKALLDGASLPEETITTPDRFAEIMTALEAGGRATYLQFQVWDLLNPLLMGVAGTMLLGWLVRRTERSQSLFRLVVVLPIVLLVADLLENGIISLSVTAFPNRARVVGALPLVTAVKFAAATSTMAAVVALVVVWIRDRLSGARRSAT